MAFFFSADGRPRSQACSYKVKVPQNLLQDAVRKSLVPVARAFNVALTDVGTRGEKKTQTKTLNGRLPFEDSFFFHDFWTELIVMTRFII